MIAYNGEDIYTVALVQWWLHLKMSSDLQRVFIQTDLKEWLKLFDPPADFLFDADDKGIWIGALLSPWNVGANLAFWVRQDKRTSREMLKWWNEFHEKALATFPVLSITSRDDSVIEQAVRLGYNEVGPLPAQVGRMAIVSREAWDVRGSKDYRNEDKKPSLVRN